MQVADRYSRAPVGHALEVTHTSPVRSRQRIHRVLALMFYPTDDNQSVDKLQTHLKRSANTKIHFIGTTPLRYTTL